jgi:hypothetical protein
MAESLRAGKPLETPRTPEPESGPDITPTPGSAPGSGSEPAASMRTLRLSGSVPPEIWNRLGTKILPKLRLGSELKIGLEFSVTVSADSANSLATDLQQILQELGLAESVKVE